MEIGGEISRCAHCNGRGTCGYVASNSCEVCKKSAGLDPTQRYEIVCSVCGGKGELWIGPQSLELHEHTHTHEATGIDESLLTQISESLNELADKFSEILEQEAEILRRLTDLIDKSKLTTSKRHKKDAESEDDDSKDI